MKKSMLLSIILSILVFSSCTKTKVVVKTKYIKQECYKPKIHEKPKPNKYESIVIKYKDDYYYCFDEDNAKVLITNWIEYKTWCENIYHQLKIVNEHNKKENDK